MTDRLLTNAQVAAECAAEIIAGSSSPLRNAEFLFDGIATQILEWLEKASYSKPLNLGVS